MKQKQRKPKKVAILICAVLSGLAGVCSHGAAQENWWRLGGKGGVSWTEVADFSVMTDDSIAVGALQPFELRPDENLLPRLEPGSASGSPSTRLTARVIRVCGRDTATFY